LAYRHWPHCVNGDPAPSPKVAQPRPNFRPISVAAKWLQVTWYGARPRPRRLCVSPLPQKGAEPPCPIFGPSLLWPNGWMDQDGTWRGGRPWSRPHCARWGLRAPLPKRGQNPAPIFGPFLLWPNGCMHQDTTWYGGMPQPRRHCVRWGPSSLSPKGAQPPPNFLSMSVVPKRPDELRCHLVWR